MGVTVNEKTGRRNVLLRMSEAGIAAIDKRAAAEVRSRSEMIRLMLAYSEQHMPKGWLP